MLILGHTGITLGTAVLIDGIISKRRSLDAQEGKLSRIDIRLLLIGSLLPDIVDKPVGQLFFRDVFSNGRIFCHTLVFLIVITLAGVYLYRKRRKTWLLVLSFGTFTHLVFDRMWLMPRTLFWPLFGLAFEREDLTLWIQNTFDALHTDSSLYIPEVVGMGILLWFIWVLVRRKKVYTFIRNGSL